MSNDVTKIHTAPHGFELPNLASVPPTDAQRAAQWAAEALTEGRYALGEALAQLARRADHKGAEMAHRAAQREMFGPGVAAVPMAGQTRDEQPARDVLCAQLVEEHGSRRMCGAVLIWHPGDQAGTLPGWYHADPEITDHVPVRG